jgi:putative phosphoribosyl transferase
MAKYIMLFKDRKDAAEQLAKRLAESLKKEITSKEQQKYDNIIVLAIPRGGVVIGDVIASRLGLKLDIIVSRKISAPDNPEFAIGAVMPDGSYLLNEDIIERLNIPKAYITERANSEKKEIERRLLLFRGSKAYDYKFEGRIVILVDDGIATGATILSAAQWLKTKQNCCKMLIVVVPVASPSNDVIDRLNQITDKIIILYTPEPFYSVGQFYENFEQVSDDEVRKIMKRHGYKIG